MDTQLFRESLTNAIRYWERMRLVYNGILFAIVASRYGMNHAAWRSALTVNLVLVLFLLAVLANVAYCAAYIPDIFVQMSGYRVRWAKYRWILFTVGTLFAGVITYFWTMGLFQA
jgi:hypothetical protein